MLEAGKLRHRVTIQEQVETRDPRNGAVNVNWVNIATVWSAINPLSAKEFIAAQAEASKVTTRITIRYNDYITAKMRLYHAAKDKYYNIEGVLSDQNSGLEYITMPCSEGVRYERGEPDAVLPVNLEIPYIEGNAEVGVTVNANVGLWANDPTSYNYQWYINSVALAGEVGSSYVINGNVGDFITVGVSGVNAAGSSVESVSDGVLIS